MVKKLSAGIIIVFVIFLSLYFLRTKPNTKLDQNNTKTQPSATSVSDKPKIISTIPDPLDETIIPADQIIEISFNKSLQNAPEFKVKIEPKIDFKVELSGDRKTAKIIPVKPYELGASYTLFIGTETKFDGSGRWGEEKIFHFRTIRYRGI